MNTFGKILVVCNLLVSLVAVGLFMALRPPQINWKEESSDAQGRELTVAMANKDTQKTEITNFSQEAKEHQIREKTAQKKLIEVERDYQRKLAEEKAQTLEADLRATAADLNNQKALAEIERLRLEIAGVNSSLQKSEADKLLIQETANKFRKEAADQKNERDATQARNLNLQQLLREKDKYIAELSRSSTGGGTGTTTFVAKNPNDPNPPPVKVKGKIIQISNDVKDGAGFLVKLSVGIDHGVSKNHTLDVYRTYPTPEYLGRVRIIDVTERDSIGRLVSRGATSSTTIRVDDLVVDTVASLSRP